MAELFKSCQACLDAWLPKEGIIFHPIFLDRSGSDQVFLAAFNLCWFGGQRNSGSLAYSNGTIKVEFDVVTSALIVWMEKRLVLRMFFYGKVVFCHDSMAPSWKEYLTQLVAKLPKDLAPPTLEFRPPVSDVKLYGGADADADIIPV